MYKLPYNPMAKDWCLFPCQTMLDEGGFSVRSRSANLDQNIHWNNFKNILGSKLPERFCLWLMHKYIKILDNWNLNFWNKLTLNKSSRKFLFFGLWSMKWLVTSEMVTTASSSILSLLTAPNYSHNYLLTLHRFKITCSKLHTYVCQHLWVAKILYIYYFPSPNVCLLLVDFWGGNL